MYRYGSFSYSIDKIKLKGKFQTSKHLWIPNKCKIRTWCEYCLPYWCECVAENETLYAFRYRYSFTLRVKGEKEGTFFICEWYNGDFKEQKQKPDAFMIEYNPNKSGARIYKAFCDTFIFYLTEIVSFDIAYDVPNATANDVVLDTIADVMSYGKTYNKTLYIAPKEDKSGRVKVYSKHIEREKLGEDIPDTLRIEASIKCKGLDFDTTHLFGDTLEQLTKTVNHLNSVKIKRKATDNEDWKIFALSCLSPEDFQKCLGMMAKQTRSNYRKSVEQASYYTLNLDVVTLALHIAEALTPWKARLRVK